MFAGTSDSGVYRSSNNGTNWTQTALSNQIVRSLAVSGNNIFSGADYYFSNPRGVSLSTNTGTNWITKNQGFNSIPGINALLITNNYIFAGTTWQSVWRRSLSEIIGIKNISTEIPSGFSLSQNYPNPFNPSTNIRYTLPVCHSGEGRNLVKLVVFDALGREALTSGVYFYRLTTDGFSDTKRMLMIK
ncbi:MAG: T9SS type A sorting domain-containing protein [Ignavibacteriae bacterium]|nr:T9SS type A sorting domain-containing protein [Ignavibacteriota bacterium]